MRPDLNIPTPADFDPPLTRCRLCGSADIGLFDQDFRQVRIDQCRGCTVLFMNPQYTDAYLTALYSRYNAPDAKEVFGETPRGGQDDHARKRDANIALIGRHTTPGRFLSIGTGSGDELRAALHQGWQVEGYDVDPDATAEVARRYNVRVYSGDLRTAGLPAGAYQCIYMDQVLEHPKDPDEYLRMAHSLLAPGGILYLGVPNILSLASRYKTLIGKRNLKPFRGRHYDTWHHLFYYSPRSLGYLLTNVFGFEVLMVGGDPVPGDKGIVGNFGDRMRARFPVLDSSFRLIARPVK
jgi:SAM-dependent methyltransferase